jgi:Fic family protein
MESKLLRLLQEEKKMRLKGGLYHQTQISLCYNSNRIEGSKLSEDQTRYIFETNTINTAEDETANIDDIIETVNHFACFDFMLDTTEDKLSESIIKTFHRILKANTSDSRKDWFRVGGYKTRPNMVGNEDTTAPAKVKTAMSALLNSYNKITSIDFTAIVNFHYCFEKIHPFQDGNGRAGRIIMFKECLKHNIVPFIIEDAHKMFYYRGLREYEKTPNYLLDTCLSAQDKYMEIMKYFDINN